MYQNGPGDESKEASESAGCMLIFSWIACITSSVLFIVASMSNIGLLVFSSPSIPIMIFFFGGYGIIVSFTGAFMMFTQSYDMPCCTTSICECLCSIFDVPERTMNGLPRRKKDRIEFRSTIQITGLTILLTQICSCIVMAFVTIIVCSVRSTKEVAMELLMVRWKLLFQSQAGYAILLQNQKEFECCGFTNDNDATAQPCLKDKYGANLKGCSDALVTSNAEMFQSIRVCNIFILIILLIGMYFVYKARKRMLQQIKAWKKGKNHEADNTWCI